MSELLLRFVQISDSHLQPDRDHRSQKLLGTPSSDDDPFIDTVNKIIMAGRDLPEPAATTRRIIETINNLPFDVDFVLHTGDIGFEVNDVEQYRAIAQLFADCRFPIYFLAGNHDHSEYLQQALGHQEIIQSTFDFVLPHKQVQFLCLDTSSGFLDDRQLHWLSEQVSKEDKRPLIVALHHHVVPLHSLFPDGAILKNHSQVRDIIKRGQSRLRGVFYGHLHVSLDTVLDGISYHCCPSTWQQFDITPLTDRTHGSLREFSPGFRIVTITPDMTHIRTIHLQR